MITLVASAFGGPIQMMIGGCLGGSGLGNGSHSLMLGGYNSWSPMLGRRFPGTIELPQEVSSGDDAASERTCGRLRPKCHHPNVPRR